MRIFHRITVDTENAALLEKLSAIGIRFEPFESPALIAFEIPEDDRRWEEAEGLVRQYGSAGYLGKRTWTLFTEQERSEAQFLAVGACWTHGYPEPSDTVIVPGTNYMPFFGATYDVDSYCTLCGCGARQKAPYRMKNEVAWGRRSILKLNWVDDELFVRPRLWEAAFRPFEIEYQPVLLHRTGTKLESVVQLIIPETAALNVNGLPYTTCIRCGRNKYVPVCRGFMPAPLNMQGGIAKSQEYFGHNGFAFKEIVVARMLYEKISDAGLRGAEFEPCS